jgi:hypothetical protein
VSRGVFVLMIACVSDSSSAAAPNVITGTKRLAKFKRNIPSREVEAMWTTLAFVSQPSLVGTPPKTALRWQFVDVLLFSKTCALALSPGWTKLEEELPPSPAQVRKALEDLNRCYTLLDSGALMPFPAGNSLLLKTLRMATKLSVLVALNGQAFRSSFRSWNGLDGEDVRHICRLWESSDVLLQDNSRHQLDDKLEDWCKDLVQELMMAPDLSVGRDEKFMDYGPILSLMPCSLTTQASSAIARQWTKAAFDVNVGRACAVLKDLETFAEELAKQAALIEDTDKDSNNESRSDISIQVQEAAGDMFGQAFASSFETQMEGLSAQNSDIQSRGAFLMREAAVCVYLASAQVAITRNDLPAEQSVSIGTLSRKVSRGYVHLYRTVHRAEPCFTNLYNCFSFADMAYYVDPSAATISNSNRFLSTSSRRTLQWIGFAS